LAFAHDFWHGTRMGAGYYRTLVTAGMALNGRFLGWQPLGFHLENVALHAVNTLLLWRLARRLRLPRRAGGMAAALFAVHPAATGVFFLLALLCKESALAFLIVPLLGLRRMRQAAGEEGPGTERPSGGHALAATVMALLVYLGLRLAAGVGVRPTGGMIDPLV